MTTLDCTIRLESTRKLVFRETRAVLVLCHHQVQGKKDKQFLRIRTQNANNRQIELGKQSLEIWRDHIKQGKATIKFTEENLMLYISLAKYERLKSFLSKIENIKETKNLSTNSPSKPQSISSIIFDENRFRTKLSIYKLKDYPKNDGKGFPRNSQQLFINNIKLQNVDLRWFNLHFLSLLSLSDNNLGKNWTLKNWRRFCSISNLTQLTELDLAKNPLKILPDCFLDSLPISLNILNLNDCSILYLSNRILRLKNLQSLNLSINLFKELPEDIYLLPRLTKLYISELPNLQFLPATLFSPTFTKWRTLDMNDRRLIFKEFDVFKNPLLIVKNKKLFSKSELDIPKLINLASAALYNNREYHIDIYTKLLRQEILDCLPIILQNEMRNNLLRCSRCFKLFPSSTITCIPDFKSISSISTIYIGPSDNLIRQQFCQKCYKYRPFSCY